MPVIKRHLATIPVYGDNIQYPITGVYVYRFFDIIKTLEKVLEAQAYINTMWHYKMDDCAESIPCKTDTPTPFFGD
jgi:hypothetical protein